VVDIRTLGVNLVHEMACNCIIQVFDVIMSFNVLKGDGMPFYLKNHSTKLFKIVKPKNN